jgi:hypothetical protein
MRTTKKSFGKPYVKRVQGKLINVKASRLKAGGKKLKLPTKR